ncbi:MAG TPA: VIT1/CCC1 transporter family protein [Chloroflexia bacterium]|nr:VIT1/CCC1 transporter family protein [Chloroflexia bacterium]
MRTTQENEVENAGAGGAEWGGSPDPATRRNLVAALREAWTKEIESMKAYRELAGVEPDKDRHDILLRLAATEEKHAEAIASRLSSLGEGLPRIREGWTSRVRSWLLRQGGLDAAVSRLEAEEDKAAARYQAQAAEIGDADFNEMLHSMEVEEEAHARVLRSMTRAAGPRNALDLMLKRERWHTRSSGWLGDAIYGANDGLGAVFGIVSGVSGATQGNERFVLIAGIAGMFASAISMGSGAYLAAKSEREVYESEIGRERVEIETDPESEREELDLFYQLKGFTPEEAKMLADRIAQNPEQMLRTMAAEELGLAEENFPDPVRSALASSISTALGAFIPIVPFFFFGGLPAIIAAGIISVVAHFLVGASKTFITGRSWLAAGTEMAVVGVIAGVVTFLIGLLLGAPV